MAESLLNLRPKTLIKNPMNIKLRTLTLGVGLLGTLLPATAQSRKNNDIRIEWGDNIPLTKKHFRIGFVGDMDQGFVQITERMKKEVGFTRISNELKFENNRVEPLPKSKYAMFESIVQVDNRAYALISDYNKETQSEKLTVREIDIKDGGFKDSGEELLVTDGKITGTLIATGMYKFSTTDKFKLVIPDHGERILVYYRRVPEKKRDSKNHDKLVYNLFDRNWKPIWSKEVTMPYTEADMSPIAHRLIGNDVYLFARTKSGQVNPETKRAEFDGLSVFHITEDGKTNEHPLELDGVNLFDIVIGDGDGSSILIAGYTKPSIRTNTFTGYLTAVFNPETFALENINMYSFKEDLISAFESERTKRKLDKAVAKGKEPGIPHLELREVIHRPGGGWYLVGEQYYFYTVTVNTGRSTYTTYHYLFMDVIISALEKDGTEAFTIKVPKNQHLVNTTYGGGIAAFEFEDKLYIFHLDHIKNKGLDESGTPVTYASMKDAALMCITVDSEGRMDRFPLFDLRDEQKVIVPYAIEEMEPGVLMSAGRKNSYYSGKSNYPALIYLK